MKNLTIYVIMLNVLFVLFALSSCSKSISPADRYAKEHRGLSYESVMRGSESFTLKSLKEDRSTLKDEIKALNKKSGHESKKEKLERELAELRAKAQENK